MAMPKPPNNRYAARSIQQDKYGQPSAPQKRYGSPLQQYELPSSASEQMLYPPKSFYGPPAENIIKNFFVHVPPEEPETYPVSLPIQNAVSKKHYKIIFIKAPNPPTPLAQGLPPPVKDEHKTLVYVLVKKPEQQQVIPSFSPTEPSKPEVYFIKYKDAQKSVQEYGPLIVDKQLCCAY